MSESQVRRSLGNLIDLKMITKVERWKEMRQTSNFYEIMVIVDSDGCLIDTTGVSDREGMGICETATPPV
jgi:hypothetical protein